MHAQNLVVTHDSVVMAAYLVAEEDSDAEYLAALLKDLARKNLTAQGVSEHAAQEELLDMIETLVEIGEVRVKHFNLKKKYE